MSEGIELTGWQVKSVKADIGNSRATVTLGGYLDDEFLDQRQHLGILAYEQGITIDVTLEQQQMVLPFKDEKAKAA